jgi:hypothetical protein
MHWQSWQFEEQRDSKLTDETISKLWPGNKKQIGPHWWVVCKQCDAYNSTDWWFENTKFVVIRMTIIMVAKMWSNGVMNME